MIETLQTTEEKNTKRVILLASTFMVLVVSFIVAYALISSEIKDFKKHLETFKSTLLQREKAAIKATVENLINDIKYEDKSKELEIRQRVKNQTLIAYDLIKLLHVKSVSDIKKAVKKISNHKNIEFFVLNSNGNLIFQKNGKLIEGANYIDLEDINGDKFVEKIVNETDFVSFYWFVSKSNKISKKITYSLKIKELDLIIGSAEFLDTKYSLSNQILNKIKEEKFGENDFVFIYEITSLSSSKNYSKLILENNIITDNNELIAIEKILENSDYKGDIFYEYDDKLIYSSFLFDDRTFISAGVNLNSIKNIIEKETKISHANLNKKIIAVVLNIIGISIVFFLFSYLMANKIERMFRNYRLKVANSQQQLIQKSKMASMGEMIGNIAHQWRQPLSQMSGIFLDLETAHAHEELTQKYLEKRTDQANDLVEYMSKTIDDFKEFYNPNAKKEIFSLLDSINNAIKLIDSSLSYYNIDLEIDIDKSLHVKGISNEFSQVILNLLSNVKDAVIQRKIKNPYIKISTKANKKKIRLSVIDNCGGIDKENINKVFEPYFTTKYNYGTGIGLYMSKIIIENKMSGQIFAKNTNNDGAKFIITLPKD